MSDAIWLVLVPVIGGAAGNMVAQWARDRNENRRTGAVVSGEVHKADLESDAAFMDRLIKRVESLETTQREMEKSARGQDAKISNLELKLERVGYQYEANRKLQRRVAHRLRDGGTIDDETLLELENAPDFERVLTGPNGAQPLPISTSNGN